MDGEMTGPEKLAMIGNQMHAQHVLGQPRLVLTCPYCGGSTSQGETFCCSLMYQAVEAILEADTVLKNLAVVERAVERHNRN